MKKGERGRGRAKGLACLGGQYHRGSISPRPRHRHRLEASSCIDQSIAGSRLHTNNKYSKSIPARSNVQFNTGDVFFFRTMSNHFKISFLYLDKFLGKGSVVCVNISNERKALPRLRY